jgi:CheY-like chemotaxis protein
VYLRQGLSGVGGVRRKRLPTGGPKKLAEATREPKGPSYKNLRLVSINYRREETGLGAPGGVPVATILLVEDDPFQAQLTTTLLGRQFGEVRRVTDAAEALCLVEQAEFASQLGLVISGHHTQGIGGPAFVAELHSRLPNLPILVLGSSDATPSDYTEEHVMFLAKPFAGAKMLVLTRQMLAEGKAVVA